MIDGGNYYLSGRLVEMGAEAILAHHGISKIIMEHKINIIDWKLVLISMLVLWIWASLGNKTTNNYYDIETAIIVDSTFDLDTAVLMGDTYDSTYSWDRLHYRDYDTPDTVTLP